MPDENGRRFICLTNTPTPYRLHFFCKLSEALCERGWNFEVWFMARSEPHRRWHFKPGDFKFQHRFFRGLSVVLADAPLHFNPGVPPVLMRQPPNILLVGGSWGMPTSVLAALSARLLDRTRILFWSESHLKSITQNSWPVDWLRTVLLRPYHGFVVPGNLALEYVRHYAPNKPAYILRNTVDESLFKDRVLTYRDQKEGLRYSLGVPENKRILLLAARLADEKGILPFLSAISFLPASVTEAFALIVAGDGPLREQLTRWVSRHSSLDVRLMGHVTEEEMVKLYAEADSFVLPSLRDPNPLSVIEALWAGLPLLLSNRVGNHVEALLANGNGWLFDPESPDAVRETLREWTEASDQKLEGYGMASAGIAQETFSTEVVAKNFLNQILN